MKIAVTGETGFVGRHLVVRHVALDDEVRYLTRKVDGLPLPGIIRYIGDLCETKRIPAQGISELVKAWRHVSC